MDFKEREVMIATLERIVKDTSRAAAIVNKMNNIMDGLELSVESTLHEYTTSSGVQSALDAVTKALAPLKDAEARSHPNKGDEPMDHVNDPALFLKCVTEQTIDTLSNVIDPITARLSLAKMSRAKESKLGLSWIPISGALVESVSNAYEIVQEGKVVTAMWCALTILKDTNVNGPRGKTLRSQLLQVRTDINFQELAMLGALPSGLIDKIDGVLSTWKMSIGTAAEAKKSRKAPAQVQPAAGATGPDVFDPALLQSIIPSLLPIEDGGGEMPVAAVAASSVVEVVPRKDEEGLEALADAANSGILCPDHPGAAMCFRSVKQLMSDSRIFHCSVCKAVLPVRTGKAAGEMDTEYDLDDVDDPSVVKADGQGREPSTAGNWNNSGIAIRQPCKPANAKPSLASRLQSSQHRLQSSQHRLQSSQQMLQSQHRLQSKQSAEAANEGQTVQAAEASEQPAKAPEQSAQASEQSAQASEQSAEASEQSAKASEEPPKASEQSAKASEQSAEASEQPAKAPDQSAPSPEQSAKAANAEGQTVQAADASEQSATASEESAQASEHSAKASEQSAKAADKSAQASEQSAKPTDQSALAANVEGETVQAADEDASEQTPKAPEEPSEVEEQKPSQKRKTRRTSAEVQADLAVKRSKKDALEAEKAARKAAALVVAAQKKADKAARAMAATAKQIEKEQRAAAKAAAKASEESAEASEQSAKASEEPPKASEQSAEQSAKASEQSPQASGQSAEPLAEASEQSAKAAEVTEDASTEVQFESAGPHAKRRRGTGIFHEPDRAV